MAAEGEPQAQPSIEEQLLIRLGLEEHLDAAMGSYTGRNFLDAYEKPEDRRKAENIFKGFLALPEDHPSYEGYKAQLLGVALKKINESRE